MNKSQKVLLVDDDNGVVEYLEDLLSEEGYAVRSCIDSKVAKKIISEEEFDLVISDYFMPEVNGRELYYFVREKSEVPFILMSAFYDRISKDSIVNESILFLDKPFEKERFLEKITEALSDDSGVDANKVYNSDDFVPIQLNEYVFGKYVRYSLYIRLGENKFVKLVHRNDRADSERLEKYSQRGLKFLYMKKSDFRDYVQFSSQLSDKVRHSPNISKDKKKNFLNQTTKMVAKDFFFNEIDEISFATARAMVEATVNVVLDEPSLEELLFLLREENEWLYAHCLSVSSLSVLIGQKSGVVAPSNCFKLAMGGLLHDIGLKEVDQKVYLKPRISRTPEDRAIYENHPTRGVEILSCKKEISDDILSIVSQHHETFKGTGYPNGLKGLHIHPLARIVGLADRVSHLFYEDKTRQRTLKEIATHIVNNEFYSFEQKLIYGLMDLVGLREQKKKQAA